MPDLGPNRVQLSRAKGWRMPPNTVKVDRTTRWGNPCIVGTHGTREECVHWFTLALSGFVVCGHRVNADGTWLANQLTAYSKMARRDRLSTQNSRPARIHLQTDVGMLGSRLAGKLVPPSSTDEGTALGLQGYAGQRTRRF